MNVSAVHENVTDCVGGTHLGEVNGLYLGSLQTEDGVSTREIKVTIAKATGVR